MRDILGDGPFANLELEDVVAPRGEHCLGFVDVLPGIARGERPGDRKAVAETAAADQFGDWHAVPLAGRVEQRRFHRAFGDPVSRDHATDKAHCRCDPGKIAMLEERGDVGIDRELHALRALVTIA